MNRNPYPKNRWTSPSKERDSVSYARLRELFWSVPKTSLSAKESEERIAAALRNASIPELVQLLEDLYEDLAR
jgi:hypothetical protein